MSQVSAHNILLSLVPVALIDLRGCARGQNSLKLTNYCKINMISVREYIQIPYC